jgi:hypothetical protein
MERPMKQNDDLSRSLIAFDQASTLVAVVELGSRKLVGGRPCPRAQPATVEEAERRCASVVDAAASLARRVTAHPLRRYDSAVPH